MKTKLALALLLLTGGASTASLAAMRTVRLAVPGMTCPMCPITIKKSLDKVPGVTGVTSDVDKKTVTVRYDDAKVHVDALTRATANAGYPATVQH